jgi:hypothetical protein
LNKKQLILSLVALSALAALLLWGRNSIHFDFGVFRAQLAMADWAKIGIAIGCIYLGYVVRAVRWALLLRHNKKVPLFSLLGTQVIGFTAIALIGRVADPVRPYLVAKKTGLPLSNQFAVYVVERLFDGGSMALIFSTVILVTAWLGAPGTLPHQELVEAAAKWGLAATALGALFLVVIRLAGGAVASFLEATLGVLSSRLGHAIGDKIRSFRQGLDTLRTLSDFAITAALSLGMWGLITLAYLETAHAFVASPQLASMTLAKCVLLLAVSGTASVLQLPVLGWFTQIGIVSGALFNFLGVAWEPAIACSATLLLVSFLVIMPVGLIWARFEHINLRKVTAESEHAGEKLAEGETA